MASFLTWAILIAVTIGSRFLFRTPTARRPARKEDFEAPRTEEGAHLPVVFGVGEISPNITWYGNVTNTEADERIEWYANMVGSLCHGPLDDLLDVRFDDLFLSAAPPSKNDTGGPALSTDLPYSFSGGTYDTMINAIHWFGGTDTVDGQGGIAGRMHVHPGINADVPCDLIKPWWGDEWVSGFPEQAYVVFGGTRGACVVKDLAYSYKWRVTQNYIAGANAGGGGAPDLGNHLLTVYENPEDHRCHAQSVGVHFPDYSLGAVCTVEGAGTGVCGAEINVACGVQSATEFVWPGHIKVKTAWQVCAGCTQGYINMAHQILCLREGDRVTVRFKWSRGPLYNFRFPYYEDEVCPEGLPGLGGFSVTLGRNWDEINDPQGISGWNFSTSVESFTPCGAIGSLENPSQFEWTVTVPGGHAAQGNIAFLGLHWGAGWRAPWAVFDIWDIVVTVEPVGNFGVFPYMADRYTEEGWFYWGTNPAPPAPTFIVRRIPKAVSGGGIIDGANPIDCIYDVLTNDTWGMSLDPSLVNLTNFQTAATRLKDEGFQVSHVVDDQTTAEELLDNFLSTVDGIAYTNRETGLWEIALVRPDYSVSLLDSINDTNARDMAVEMPQTGDLINELRVRFRRFSSSHVGETITDYDLGPAPYHLMQSWKLPGTDPTNVVLKQGAVTYPSNFYTVSKEGTLQLRFGAAIDYDGPTHLTVTFTTGGLPPGFEDAVATAFNEAAWTALGEIRSETVDLPMIMDDIKAQWVAENILLGRARPLKTFRWTMTRTIPDLHPGMTVKVTWPELGVSGLPVRVIDVRDGRLDQGDVTVEAIEEKWGFIEKALIFEPYPERPEIGFPGEEPVGLGTAPRPLGLAQIQPSSVRLALFAADTAFNFEIARTRVPEFYTGPDPEHGGTGCAANIEPVYFTVIGTATYFDDPVTDDGCPYYYWVRHIKSGWNPSAWVGPIEAVLSNDPPPGTTQAPLAPTIVVQEFEDFTVAKGYVVLWLLDPQLRITRIQAKTRVEGEDWSLSFDVAVGGDWDNETDFPSSAGWKSAAITVNIPTERTIEVYWKVEWAWSPVTAFEDGTTLFPLYREPVWTSDGRIVTAGDPPEVVTASRLNTAGFAPTLVSSDGEELTTSAGEILTL